MDIVSRRKQPEVVEVERVQTGVRLERRLLKVLKALAELKDMSVGDLLEGIVLHAFEGKPAFAPQTLKQIEQFSQLYGMTLKASRYVGQSNQLQDDIRNCDDWALGDED